MLHEFLATHDTELIARCRAKVGWRSAPESRNARFESGIPVFLDQLIKTLLVEQTSEPLRSRKVSGPAGGGQPVASEIGAAAGRHGRDLLRSGFTVNEVVHDYGDLCQAITEVAIELDAPISVQEFQTLNRCLDNAIADAVTEFTYQHDFMGAERDILAVNERLGTLAHDLRNLVHTASLAFTAIKVGGMGMSGATGGVLERTLLALSSLADRSLSQVRMNAELPARHHRISVASFVADIKSAATLEAQAHQCAFSVSEVDTSLAVNADPDQLSSAVSNLLQNAFKFTRHDTVVSLNAYAVGDRVLIDVEDACGGLPAGDAEGMCVPFTQRSMDKSGIGLGLSSCRRNVEANDGTLRVRDMPGIGCVFTVDLPRHSLPAAPVSAEIFVRH